MLEKKPEDRISVQEILNHGFFKLQEKDKDVIIEIE